MAIARPDHRGGRTTASAVTASLAVLTLAGCTAAGPAGDATSATAGPSSATSAATGGSGTAAAAPRYEDLFPAMVAAVASMKTARVKGQITEGAVPITVDIRGTLSDTEVFGQVTDKAGPLTILRVKGTTYVRATREYWNKQIGRRAARAIATNWVPMPAKTPLGAVTVGALIKQTFDFTPDDASLRDSTVTRSHLGKVPVYVVTSPDGLRTLYLFAGGRPLPLRYTVRAAAADPASSAPAPGPSADQPSNPPPVTAPVTTASGTDPSRFVTDIEVTSWNLVPPVQAPSAESVVSP